jgi:hypothetical protein
MEASAQAGRQIERELLLAITHCPVVPLCIELKEPSEHPCFAVVRAQSGINLTERQVPEPWNGDLLNAPLLFVSSNPAINLNEDYPDGNSDTWPVERNADFFTHRFGGGAETWTLDGRRPRQTDGSFATGDGQFWGQISGRARDILGRPDVRGVDWALTEVVHCKSVAGAGVAAAADYCANR